jgi:NADH-quinone oxidoreductase subunit L
MAQLPSANLVWLIPALPLIGFLFNAFLGRRMGKTAVAYVAPLVVLASFAVSVKVFLDLLALSGEAKRASASLLPTSGLVPWIHIGSFQVDFGALIDPLSMLMCLIVTGIGGLIHIYSTGYMASEKDHSRFFTYLNLFIFFMLLLVLGDNLLLMFVGWEGVGACSYLLISFWFEDKENSKAGNKAFIVNRIGDVGFALGVMMIFSLFGTLTFYKGDGTGFLDQVLRGVTTNGALTAGAAGTIALLLFVGACGKSAQIPLYVWLPDAMAGPTPVSALIHAATMVTAGVVMITRCSPIVVLNATAMNVIAGVGLATALFAATIALTQNDIKKVLAYSTVSQLGYMFLGCGVGAFSAAMFHVTTHAFFKALLFLGAGSVIHAMHHEQDMRKMGGLKNRIRITHATMCCGWIAICGFPLTSGFFSKDEILGYASGAHGYGMVFYAVGLLTAFMTAFYMSRLMWKTFWTRQRFLESELGHGHHGDADAHAAADDKAHGDDNGHVHSHTADDADHGHGHPAGVHESPPSMTVPLMILAVLSLFGGLMGLPGNSWIEHFLEPSVAKFEAHHGVSTAVGLGIGALVGIGGMLYAMIRYRAHMDTGELLTEEQKRSNPLYQGSLNLWYVDRTFTTIALKGGGAFANVMWQVFDRRIIDGLVNLAAGVTALFSELARRMQSGFVRSYATLMLLGVAGVVMALLYESFSKH